MVAFRLRDSTSVRAPWAVTQNVPSPGQVPRTVQPQHVADGQTVSYTENWHTLFVLCGHILASACWGVVCSRGTCSCYSIYLSSLKSERTQWTGRSSLWLSISVHGDICGCLTNRLEIQRGKAGLREYKLIFSGTQGRPAGLHEFTSHAKGEGCDDTLYEHARLSNMFLLM